MYLCIGQDAVVPSRDIIAVLDMDNATRGKDTRSFLEAKEAAKALTSLGDGIPRSIVLCMNRKGERVYLSPVTAATLTRRANNETKEEL